MPDIDTDRDASMIDDGTEEEVAMMLTRLGPPVYESRFLDHLETQKTALDEALLRDGGGLATFMSSAAQDAPLTTDAILTLWESVPELTTLDVRFDGCFAPDESDQDDTPLAVGDRVRVSYAGILGIPASIRPFYYGTVQSVEPWDDDLAGMIFVSLDHAKHPEHGAWMERERLSKIRTPTEMPQ